MKNYLIIAFGLLASPSSIALAKNATDVSPVIRLACSDPAASADGIHPVANWRIAEAALLFAGIRVDHGLSGAAYEHAVLAKANEIAASGASEYTPARDVLRDIGLHIRADTRDKTEKDAILQTNVPASIGEFIVLDPANSFICTAPSRYKSILEQLNGPSGIPHLGLVHKIDDLGATGADRLAAGSASVGLKIDVAQADDGSRKRTTTLTFDGVVGLLLPHTSPTHPGFAYAAYSLSRERTRPAPVLGAGVTVDDGDTNTLELGLTVPSYAPGRVFEFALRGGYVFDFVKDSERLSSMLSATIQPRRADIGICKVGGLKTQNIGKISFRSICSIGIESEFGHVFHLGRASFENNGNFLSVGPAFVISFAPPAGAENGIVGKLAVHYRPVVSGVAPDILRLESSLKYRWWFMSDRAIDAGFEYTLGREDKSFARQNVLQLSLGLLF